MTANSLPDHPEVVGADASLPVDENKLIAERRLKLRGMREKGNAHPNAHSHTATASRAILKSWHPQGG